MPKSAQLVIRAFICLQATNFAKSAMPAVKNVKMMVSVVTSVRCAKQDSSSVQQQRNVSNVSQVVVNAKITKVVDRLANNALKVLDSILERARTVRQRLAPKNVDFVIHLTTA